MRPVSASSMYRVKCMKRTAIHSLVQMLLLLFNPNNTHEGLYLSFGTACCSALSQKVPLVLLDAAVDTARMMLK
jgi:hypothetical protein